jgi:hypothetical protein
MTMRLEPLPLNRPTCRQVLDCASPLAFWVDASSAKAVEGHRTPGRYRDGTGIFRIMACELVQQEHEAFHKSVTFLSQAAQWDRNLTP